MQTINTRLSPWHIVAVIVLVPLLLTSLALWQWKPSVFVLASVLALGGARVVYELFVMKKMGNRAYQLAFGLAIAAVLLLMWMNAAVGGILGDNPANMMYFGVLLVGLAGAIIARLEAKGMSHALFATAFAMLLVPLVAWLIGTPAFANGLAAVFALHACFAWLFAGSALLFRRAARSSHE
ncbi:hypothetical protein SAMN05216327_106246 [Dyadobacter sp. SG02]|uniref:hypothetical protein n=1 Tax=Dyadobacter sp. SG02 TaxID=1855291 RepID=UPI0008B82012|nr:hypothetical protein [Dyadobacter sp. SG02]SEJ13236.1 hypothetical protein SAMN05216327_106246 [Dyadobacter sp. SG02]